MKRTLLIAAIVFITNVNPSHACGQSACAYNARAVTYRTAVVSSAVLIASTLIINGVIAFSTMNLSSEFSDEALKRDAETVSKLSIALSMVQGVALMPAGMLAISAAKRDGFVQLHQGDGARCVRFGEYLLASGLVASSALWAASGVLIAQLMSGPTVTRLVYPLWLTSTIMTGVSFVTSVHVAVFGHLLRKYGAQMPPPAIRVEPLEMH